MLGALESCAVNARGRRSGKSAHYHGLLTYDSV